MSEQRKPKIDLKARLGKKSAALPTGAPSVPPPVGIPKPPVMTGMPRSMPAARPSASPRVDASDPYAAIDASYVAPRAAEPKAIKVEMSEEVVQAQKKGRGRVMLLAGIACGVGALLGFAFGSGYQRGVGADVALEGAQELVKEVDEANVQAKQLLEVLEGAAEKLGDNKYPEEEMSKLGGINVPFEGANLVGKGIGRFKPDVVSMLITYSSSAQSANEQKDRIQRILAGSKQGVTELLEEKENPKVRWSVYVIPGPYGPWANMQLVPDPFLVKSDKKEKDKDGKETQYSWPSEFKIKEGDQTHTLKRYTKGEPMGGDPQLIPVVPDSQSGVCPSDTILKLRKELAEMQRILKGDSTPGIEKMGLLQVGDNLQEALKKIGAPS